MSINKLHGYRIIGTVNEYIFCCLIGSDPEFSINISLEFIVVTIQMIFGDIGKYRHICSKITNIIQLKTADFGYI